MKAVIRLDTRRKGKKGFPIKIYLTGNGKEKWIPTGYYSKKEHWNNGRANRYHPDQRHLNHQLSKLESKISEQSVNTSFKKMVEILSIKDRDSEIMELERRLKELKGDNKTMFFDFWENTFIPEIKSEGKSTRAYDGALEQFKQFRLYQDIPINDINYELLREFKTYKYNDGCGDGGIATYLRKIRTVFLEAQKRESLGVKSGNPFKGVIPETRKRETVELTRGELEKIRNFVPSKFTSKANAEAMTRRRDIWLFQLYIGGHDFADIAMLRNTDIRNGRIRFKRYKNRRKKDGGALVDNVLHPLAFEILEKWGNKKGRVFDFIPEPRHETAYNSYRKNTNRALFKISMSCELACMLKTKSPRYIFKKWASDMKCDFLATKQVQGQKVPDVSMRYLSGLDNSLADEVINTVISFYAYKQSIESPQLL